MGVEVEVECVKAELYKGTGLDEINIKFWPKNCQNSRFLVNHSSLNHKISLILHILTGRHVVHMIRVVLWLRKKFRAKFEPRLDSSPNYFCLQKPFSTATHQNFFFLHIMINNYDI